MVTTAVSRSDPPEHRVPPSARTRVLLLTGGGHRAPDLITTLTKGDR
jgi:hypothetical protein